jgi:hypothetical protein
MEVFSGPTSEFQVCRLPSSVSKMLVAVGEKFQFILCVDGEI